MIEKPKVHPSYGDFVSHRKLGANSQATQFPGRQRICMPPRPPQEEWGHDLLTNRKQISKKLEDGQDGLPVWAALQLKQIAIFKKAGEGTANYGEPYGGFLKN